MTRTRAKELLPIIQAYVEGKVIQYTGGFQDTPESLTKWLDGKRKLLTIEERMKEKSDALMDWVVNDGTDCREDLILLSDAIRIAKEYAEEEAGFPYYAIRNRIKEILKHKKKLMMDDEQKHRVMHIYGEINCAKEILDAIDLLYNQHINYITPLATEEE